jgi:hypothetical protein
MSGDAPGPVAAIAGALGFDRAFSELLPEDKAERVRELKRAGKTVAMVGDGINDAPALAVADIGISLHGGTEVALETADVLLLQGGLARLPLAFAAGDRAMAHLWRGLGLIIVPNAVAIGLGALGLLSPPVAAVVNNGATIFASLVGLEPLFRQPAPDGGAPGPLRSPFAAPSPARHPASGSPVEESMQDDSTNNKTTTPLFAQNDGQPAASGDGESVALRIGVAVLLPAVVALGGGAGIVAAAVAWGAAEAAVGVGAAYLLYATLTGKTGDLTNIVRAGVHALSFAKKPQAPTDHGEPGVR